MYFAVEKKKIKKKKRLINELYIYYSKKDCYWNGRNAGYKFKYNA